MRMATHGSSHIEATIRALKNPADPGEPSRLAVRSGAATLAYLRAVPSVLRGEAAQDAALMARWRNAHREAFFTWTEVTEEGTRRWLADSYASSDTDVIFMVENADREPFGQLALYGFDFDASSCELGRVLRGSASGASGAMTLATEALLSWARSELALKTVFLKVFDDNVNAIALYERCGFVAAVRTPLQRRVEGDATRWVEGDEEDKAPERFSLRMDLDLVHWPDLRAERTRADLGRRR